MEENNLPQLFTPPQPEPKKPKNRIPVWVIVLMSVVGLLAIAFVIAWAFYLKSQKEASPDYVEKSTPAVEEVVEVVSEDVPEEAVEAEAPAKETPTGEIDWTEKRAEKRTSSSSNGNKHAVDAYVCNDEYRYPVRIEYTLMDDGRVKGRYAYASTIRKYGDKPSSWFRLSGTYDKNIGSVNMSLKSYLHDKTEPFETLRLRVTSDGVRGILTNCDNGKRFDIEP